MNTGKESGGSRLAPPRGSTKPKDPSCEEVDIETRVQQLEDRWQELNSLPTNSEMWRRLRKFRENEEAGGAGSGMLQNTGSMMGSNAQLPAQGSNISGMQGCQPMHRTGQPMSELWHSMQLLNQVETNTEGITRVRVCQLLFDVFVLTASRWVGMEDHLN